VTERQQQILEWLRRQFPHEGQLFESAVRLRADETMPSRARLIGHAYREMCSGLANVNGQTKKVDMNQLLDSVARHLQDEGITLDETPLAGDDPIPKVRAPITVRWNTMKAVKALVGAHAAQPRGPSRAQALFDRMHGRPPTEEVSPSATRWHEMTRTFVYCCHNRDTADAVLLTERIDPELDFLEETLTSFAQGAVANLNALDDILEQANT
jgi:hypothetical protein